MCYYLITVHCVGVQHVVSSLDLHILYGACCFLSMHCRSSLLVYYISFTVFSNEATVWLRLCGTFCRSYFWWQLVMNVLQPGLNRGLISQLGGLCMRGS